MRHLYYEMKRRRDLRRATQALEHAGEALRNAIREIDRNAIVSHEASALYRAFETYLTKMDEPWRPVTPESGR